MSVRTTRGRILVIRGGAIGDFILTLPAIGALRRQFPDAHLEILGYPHIAQLALLAGVADQVRPIEARGLASFFARNGELDAATMDFFAQFNVIISYLFDPDDHFKSNVARCTRAQFIQGPHRPIESERTHATLVYLKPLERLAIFDADPVPRLVVGQASCLSGAACVDNATSHAPFSVQPDRRDACPTIALHPGSGSDTKNWPEANWATLLAQLIATTSAQLLLVGGEAEGDRLERLAKPLPPERIQIARSLPLNELAMRLGSCAAFIGHDSGISHLAAALGLPTLVLWGNTIEEIWRPRGERVTILKSAGSLHALEVPRVLAEVQNLLARA